MPDFSNLKPEDLERMAQEMRQGVAGKPARSGLQVVSLNTPQPEPASPYAVTGWGSNLYDFEVPSGQLCQMKKLRPDELIGTGILDKLTRLPGLAEEQIQKAEGKPPVKEDETASEKQIMELLPVINQLVCLVVVQPKVWPEPSEDQEDNIARVEGRVYIGDVDLADQVAIMERVTSGVRKMDNFRAEAGGAVQRVVDEPINGVSS